MLIIALATLAFNLLRYHPPVFTRENEPSGWVSATLPPGSKAIPAAPTPPRWSAFVLLSLALGGMGVLIWRLSRPSPPKGASEPLEQLRPTAGTAGELGLSLQDPVIWCYHRMSRLLAKKALIPNYPVLTPREFEERLHALGMADEHVALLSRLFERVRYGHHLTTPNEERIAKQVLHEIEKVYGQSAEMSARGGQDRQGWALGSSLSSR